MPKISLRRSSGRNEVDPTLTVAYDSTARTLVDAGQRIAIIRQDVSQVQANGSTKTIGENIAYAWQDGVPLEQMQRVVYIQYKYRDASGTLVSAEGWVSMNPVSGARKIWTGSDWSANLLVSIYDSVSQAYVPLN